MFTRKKFFWLSAVLVAASSYLSFGPVTASAAVPQPATEEMKLLVDPAVLQDRTAGWQQLWQLLQKTAAAQHIELSESQTPFKEGCRSIHYLDTKDQALGKKNYILRQRIKIGKNGLSKHCDLMLKYRAPEDSAALPSPEDMGEQHQERDYIGNVDGKIGSNRAYISQSRSIKKVTADEIVTFQDYAGYFPVLHKLLPAETAELLPVNNISIIEYKITPGALHFASLSAPITISYWLNDDTRKPIAAEISWNCSTQPAAELAIGRQFFNTLQQQLGNLLLPGSLKDDLIKNKA